MEHIPRLEQVWRTALALFPSHPSLAASYVRQLMRVAREQSLSLASTFYWNACSHCGLLWYAGISCRVRVVPYRLLRANIRRLPSQYVLLGPLMGASGTSRSERTTCSYAVYECFGCGVRSIFDGHPQTTGTTAAMGQQRRGASTSIRSGTINVSADPKLEGTVPQGGATDTGRPPSKTMDKRKLDQLQKILNRSSSITKGAATGSGAGAKAKDKVLASFLQGLNNPDKKNIKKS